MFLKICGITRLADAEHAVQHGATALGFVFWKDSPRAIAVDDAAAIIRALPRTVATVGVFVDAPVGAIHDVVARAGISMAQLHGNEPADYASLLQVPFMRSVTLNDAESGFAGWPADATFLLDAADPVRRGGTGVTVDWGRAAGVTVGRRVILAGGLTAGNVAEAIARVNPYGVDVSSGVEEAPGVKNQQKVAAFLANARAAGQVR